MCAGGGGGGGGERVYLSINGMISLTRHAPLPCVHDRIQNQWTPLHLAADRGRGKNTQVMIDAQAKLDCLNKVLCAKANGKGGWSVP